MKHFFEKDDYSEEIIECEKFEGKKNVPKLCEFCKFLDPKSGKCLHI